MFYARHLDLPFNILPLDIRRHHSRSSSLASRMARGGFVSRIHPERALSSLFECRAHTTLRQSTDQATSTHSWDVS